MDIKIAIELVKKSHPYATKYRGVKEDEALQVLVDLAQRYLKMEMPPKTFEDYLMEKHAEQYIGTKDCMIDDFNKWVQELGIDEIIELGEKFASNFRLWQEKCLINLGITIDITLCKRIKHIGENEQIYTGCPTDLIEALKVNIRNLFGGGE